MSKDITNVVRSCSACKRNKVTRHTKAALQEFPPAKERFSHLHIDIIGPLPVLNTALGYPVSYLLSVIDRATNWSTVIPLMDIKTETVAEIFNNDSIVQAAA